MEYKLTEGSEIIRVNDNASIPMDAGNRDYQEFLAWKKDGGVPTSFEVDVDKDVKKQMAQLESVITIRRLREAILGTDNGWLAQTEAQISILRGKLRKGGPI